MNVILLNDKKSTRKQWIIYSLIAVVCIISIVVAFYLQFYGRIDLFGIKGTGTFGNKNENEITELEEEFNQIFVNTVNNEESEYNNKKEDVSKALVYSKYNIKNIEPDSYNIEIAIPNINIKSDIVKKYNDEIENTFVEKCRRIVTNPSKNEIYQVSYIATVEEGILSLIIHSTLKEGNDAQRLIIKTYNYDLRNNKEITLDEILKIKNLDSNDVQKKINKKIEDEHKKAQALIDIGYPVFDRDVDDDMYKLENTKEFYLSNNALYIIYPYGNTKTNNEMDLIIF